MQSLAETVRPPQGSGTPVPEVRPATQASRVRTAVLCLFLEEFSSGSLAFLFALICADGRLARDPLRLAFARDAGPDECVVAGPGQLQRIPFALLTNRVHPGVL